MEADPPPHRSRRYIDLRRARWSGLFAALTVLSGQAWAGAGLSYGEASRTPCRVFTGSVGSTLFGDMQDALVAEFQARPSGDYFGSACNIGDYVIKTCRSHPSFTVGDAVDDLFTRREAGRPLPRIGQCGA